LIGTASKLLVACALGVVWAGATRAAPAANVTIWDTGAHLGDDTGLANRDGWTAVPSELFILEADPPKAASDPGYYGREYSFKGDAVVETPSVLALFSSAQGRVILYSKVAQAPSAPPIAQLSPLDTISGSAAIRNCAILRNAGDEAILEVTFGGSGSLDQTATFSFGRTQIVEIKPGDKMAGMRVQSPMAYGVVPSFIADDLIFDPADYSPATNLYVPSESMLVGLERGENNLLVVTWPKGKQRVSLGLAEDQGTRLVESVHLETEGQSFHLAALSAPGIWHRDELKPTYLEKDVASGWKRPFAAKWKTQLVEAGVTTTFNIRETKGDIWRGVPGSYTYPVWFEGDTVYYHLGKKVPPKGQSIIYFLEGQNTPLSITTPADILQETLGRAAAGEILDLAGRKLRTHHRRGGDGVHRACTCGCTEAIQAVFEAHQEESRKQYVAGAVDDMTFFVRCHVGRIGEYQRFAEDLTQYLHGQATAAPGLKDYLDNLEQIVGQIPHECEVQKENMKSPAYMNDLVKKTLALTSTDGTNNLTAYNELLKAWRGMGGAQDYVVAQCHALTRKLAQEAGYGCVNQPKAVPVAEEVRRRCRQTLRNPDGYEIWADY
jgi:hypothetical protein